MLRRLSENDGALSATAGFAPSGSSSHDRLYSRIHVNFSSMGPALLSVFSGGLGLWVALLVCLIVCLIVCPIIYMHPQIVCARGLAAPAEWPAVPLSHGPGY